MIYAFFKERSNVHHDVMAETKSLFFAWVKEVVLVVDLGNLKKCPLKELEIQVCRMLIGLELSIRGTSSGTDACNKKEDKIV